MTNYGTSVYWLDYHPLSKLICRVKTTRFLPDEIRKETKKIIRKAKKQKEATETVRFANKDFWFQKSVQDGLADVTHIDRFDIQIKAS